MAKRKTKKEQEAEAQAAQDAAADAAAEEQQEADGEGDGDAETGPTEEELAQQFEEDVEAARADMGAAKRSLMSSHMAAVGASTKFEEADRAYKEKNSKALENLRGAKTRVAAARTAVFNDWNDAVGDSTETTTIEPEEGSDEKPITFLNALEFDFEDDNDTPEKRLWLSIQSYLHITRAVGKEPATLTELREAAEEAEAAFDYDDRVYDEALRRQLNS